MKESDYNQLKTKGLPNDLSEDKTLELMAEFVNNTGNKRDVEAIKKSIEILKPFLNKNISAIGSFKSYSQDKSMKLIVFDQICRRTQS